MNRHKLLRLLWMSANNWIEDRASSMAAAIAYYTAFSMAPLLLIVIAVAGLVFGDEAARSAVLTQVEQLVGANGAEAVRAVLAGTHGQARSTLSAIIGVVALAIGATTVFAELQSDLDRIWKVPQATGGMLNTLKTRLLSFGLVLGLGFLLLVSLLVSTAIAAFGSYVGQSFPGEESLLQAANTVLAFVVITVVFAAIYKFLPHTPVRWSQVWTGAAFTSALFSVGKFLIGLYIGKAALASSFGAAGAFVVSLAWIYYSAMIFLFGAEVTYQYAQLDKSDEAGVPSPSLPPGGTSAGLPDHKHIAG